MSSGNRLPQVGPRANHHHNSQHHHPHHLGGGGGFSKPPPPSSSPPSSLSSSFHNTAHPPSRLSSSTSQASSPSTNNDSSAGYRRLKYLEGPSNFVGDINFDISIPPPLPEYKFLSYPLAREVFCGYRPTSLELQSLQLPTSIESGIIVDLIDPVSAYPPASDPLNPSLAPEDAELLVGVIPGVEKYLTPSSFNGITGSTSGSEHPNKPLINPNANLISPQEQSSFNQMGGANVNSTSAQGSARKSELYKDGKGGGEIGSGVDIVVQQFDSDREYIHPTKPHLKPVLVLPLLPHPTASSNGYLQAAIEGSDHILHAFAGSSQLPATQNSKNSKSSAVNDKPILLLSGEVWKQLHCYGLFKPRPSQGNSRPEKVAEEDENNSNNSESVSQSDAAYVEGSYQYVRDFVVRMPDAATKQQQSNFLIEIFNPPPSSSLSSPNINIDERSSDQSKSGSIAGEGGERQGEDDGSSNSNSISRNNKQEREGNSSLQHKHPAAYILPLQGQKLIFSKATATGLADVRRRRPPIELSTRERTSKEEEMEAEKWKVFRDFEAVNRIYTSQTASPANSRVSSPIRKQESRSGTSSPKWSSSGDEMASDTDSGSPGISKNNQQRGGRESIKASSKPKMKGKATAAGGKGSKAASSESSSESDSSSDEGSVSGSDSGSESSGSSGSDDGSSSS